MDDNIITKISAMEGILNDGAAAIKETFASLEKLVSMEGDLKKLFAYYGSPAWFDDRERDSRGDFPRDLPRGVLTEDAVYDLLTELVRLKTETQQLCDSLLREEQEQTS